MLLNTVKNRGFIKVGISSSLQKPNNEFNGINTDLAKAIAAAIFQDASKVEYIVSETITESLNSVVDGEVDVVLGGITNNLGRDAGLRIDFAPTYLYDYQSLLVRKDSNAQSLFDLKGKTIGTVKDTTSEDNLLSLSKDQGIEFLSKYYESNTEMVNAYDRGEVDAISLDRTLLFNSLETLSEPEEHTILTTELSKEPLAVVVPENDSEWADIIRWVTYALIEAEELGITSENINDIIDNTTDPYILRFLGQTDNLGEKLGLSNDFIVQIIENVGNYGEIYERNYPDLDRDRNYLWGDDGLLYSPPFAGTVPDNITLIDNNSRNLLQEIKDRGVVKLGVINQIPGLGIQQPDGEWKGFDIELGKAVAAAVFGSPDKLEVVVQDFSQGFDDVANGNVDIFAAGVTHNLARDAALGVDFSPTYIYDGQGFLVKKDSGINFVSDLNGRTIGLTSSTTGLQNIEDYFTKTGGSFIPQLFDNETEMFAAYERGEVDAVSTDQTRLIGLINDSENSKEHKLLNEVISKEPLALVIDENQSEWADIVRWTTYTLAQAEEFGITSENIDELITKNTDENPNNDSDSKIRTFLGIEGNIGEALGLAKDFVVNVIKAVGNYGEIYARSFDTNILPRNENKLYEDFGLQYSPPFTNASIIDSGETEEDIIPEEPAKLTLTQEGTNFLSINGDLNLAKLKLSLTSKDINKGNIHEVGLFVVDDAKGSINGLLPNTEGYLQTALERSQTIFSIIADDFVPNPTRTLENFSGKLLSFYLIQKGTTDEVINNPSAREKVLFGSSGNVLQITSLDNNQFQLAFEDALGDSTPDITINIGLSETASTMGSKLQGNSERELIDLTEFSGQSIETVFPIIKSEAAYNNTVGFYRIENEQGAVLDPVTGQLLNPGDAGYTEAAIRNSQEYGMGFDRNSTDYNTTLEGGYLFAPYLIADGTVSELLENGSDKSVYFAYMGANPDKVDHIRLLGDNTWGFEDLAGGGDKDYNDIVIQAKFSVL